jgi:hypothetical protein
MKFIIALVLTALLSFALSLFFTWWIIAIAAFIVAFLIHQKGIKAFLSAFLALFLLWGIQAFILDQANDHILATKIASLLPLGGSYILLILVTAFIGALVAGMGGLTGSLLRRSTIRRKS